MAELALKSALEENQMLKQQFVQLKNLLSKVRYPYSLDQA